MVRAWLAAAAAGILLSCTPPPPAASTLPTAPRSLPAVVWDDLNPTPEEQAWRDLRRAQAPTLRGVTVSQAGCYEIGPDGRPRGLDARLAADFAQVLGLGLEVEVAPDLSGFFSQTGGPPPDRLKSADLYVGPFAILPWRDKLVTMVPLYPMQNFLAGRRGEEIRTAADLSGRRLVLLRDSMQDNLLQDLAQQKGLVLHLVYVSPDTDVFGEVAAGRADYALDGGLFFAQHQESIRNLSLSAFPTDPVRVGWACRKDEPVLASLVAKYFHKVQESGAFAQWFEESLGPKFSDYLRLLTGSQAQGSLP